MLPINTTNQSMPFPYDAMRIESYQSIRVFGKLRPQKRRPKTSKTKTSKTKTSKAKTSKTKTSKTKTPKLFKTMVSMGSMSRSTGSHVLFCTPGQGYNFRKFFSRKGQNLLIHVQKYAILAISIAKKILVEKWQMPTHC